MVCEGKGELPGGAAATWLMTLGFAPDAGRFVGTWILSTMTHLWIYDGGGLDPAGKVLTLRVEGPDLSGERKMVKYEDRFEFITDDHRVMSSCALGDDGKWREFVTTRCRRAV